MLIFHDCDWAKGLQVEFISRFLGLISSNKWSLTEQDVLSGSSFLILKVVAYVWFSLCCGNCDASIVQNCASTLGILLRIPITSFVLIAGKVHVSSPRIV